MLALRYHGVNAICLSAHPHQHTTRKWYSASNLITVPMTPSNGTTVRVENVSIILIKCQWILNKCDQTYDAVKVMDLDALVIAETWLINNVSYQNIVGDALPVGNTLYHAVRIHNELGCGHSCLWFFKAWNRFAHSSLNLILNLGRISVHISVIYLLHPIKKMAWKLHISVMNIRNTLTNVQILHQQALCNGYMPNLTGKFVSNSSSVVITD